jgi:basic amino acid/polyamine antiporter, APA family
MDVGTAAGATGPSRRLRRFDTVALTVGIVVGAGIFRAPSVVAGGVEGELALAGVWALGGLLSMIGALCYGELVCAFPSPGGEYHFLRRAFGRKPAFLFAWGRLTVTSTGSIAILAYIFGDYATTLLPLGAHSSAVYAAAIAAALTLINVLGLRFGAWVQNVFTVAVVLSLVALSIAGLALGDAPAAAPAAPTSSLGLAMVFVLLTYGGWNEAAYLSAEVRGGRRSMAAVIVIGVGAVTLLYLLVNAAYARVLGIEGLRESTAVGADVMSRIAGPAGARSVALLIAAAALTSMNATIVTGSRTGFALGRDFHVFRGLGRWNDRAAAPVPALLVQGAIVLVLVALGALSRQGFETMVEYTAPVFWGFFLLTGIALLVLRMKEPDAPRPFRVPLYPLTPLLFCASSAWLLHASLAYTGFGALIGVMVLAAGALPLWLETSQHRARTKEMS